MTKRLQQDYAGLPLVGIHPARCAPSEDLPTQYFDGIPPDLWNFHVGGYQVLDKWLKDRRGRVLSSDDITHYQRMVVALGKTITLMTQIDAAIPTWPIE